MSKIPILEVFGPTLQGEGPQVGRKVMFIRTAGCDYQCSWCDSAFTWNGEGKDQIRMLTPTEIIMELETLDKDFDYLVISGGNPALIGNPMELLIDLLHEEGVTVALETQGSKWQDWFIKLDDLILSPKAPSSGMKTDYLVLASIVERVMYTSNPFVNSSPNLSFKIVVFDDADFDYAKYIHKHYATAFPFYLSVGNTDVKEGGDIYGRVLADYQKLVDKVLADRKLQNIRVLPQIHTLLWGNRKGV